MTVRLLTGSKTEIARKFAGMEGDVREAIVFVEEPAVRDGTTSDLPADIFAEMETFTVRQSDVVDDSREAIYERMEGE